MPLKQATITTNLYTSEVNPVHLKIAASVVLSIASLATNTQPKLFNPPWMPVHLR